MPVQAGVALKSGPTQLWRRTWLDLCFVTFLIISSSGCSAMDHTSTAYTKGSAQHHRVIVTYKIDERAGGLVNQMLCHIGAFLLALSLRAEIVLPQALSRSTFDTAWWQQEWQERPIDTLLDVDRIIRHWRRRGVCIHKVDKCIVLYHIAMHLCNLGDLYKKGV